MQPRIVDRDPGRGGHRAYELRIVVERGVVDEHRELAAVALDGRDGAVATPRGQRDRLPATVDVGALARHAVGQHEPRIAQHLGEAALQPHAAQRAELPEEVRQPPAREPGAQQAPEQRGRNRQQSRIQERHERDGRRLRDERREVRGVQNGAQAAAEAREQSTPAWPRRRAPAVGGHTRDAERRDGQDGPLELRQHVRDAGIRPHEQQVALVRQEELYGELHHQEPEDERLDEDQVDPRREPAAGHEAQDQRGVERDPQLAEQQGEGERERRVDLTEDRGQQDTESCDRQRGADRAVRAPAPRDEAAGREGHAREVVEHLVRRHRRAAVEEHGDLRDQTRGGG